MTRPPLNDADRAALLALAWDRADMERSTVRSVAYETRRSLSYTNEALHRLSSAGLAHVGVRGGLRPADEVVLIGGDVYLAGSPANPKESR